MNANFYTKQAAETWLKSAAPFAVAAFFSTVAYAQEAPMKPVNLQAVQENGYVTLTWDRLAKADTLLSEGFEAKDFPDGWTVKTTNTYDKTFTWFRFPTAEQEDGDEEDLNMWRHSGVGSAIVSFDQVGEHEDGTSAAQDEWLVLPATKGAQYLNFYTYIDPTICEYGQYEDFPDHYCVKVSHDGGATWTDIWDARYDSNGSDDWQLVSLYLGDASEGDPIVAFEAKSNLDDETTGLYFTWAIDDVRLFSEAVDAASSPQASRARTSRSLASLPSFRPFAATGKKVARSVRSAYRVQPAASTYTVLLDDEVIAENVKTTVYTDKSEKTPGEHRYGVRAVSGAAQSETAEVTVDVKAPETNAPRNVKAEPSFDEQTGKYRVLLSWEAPEGDRQPDHYECYANDALFAGWVDPEELSVEQTGVNRGVQFYAVKAVYANPDGESALVGDLAAIGTRNTVSSLNASVEDGNAQLTWNAPKVSEYEVEKYLVFRGGKPIGETTATEYTDENIPEGTYDYNVKAVYADGFVSLPVASEVTYGEEPTYDVPFAEDFNSGLKPADWAVERVNSSMKTDYLWRFDNWWELPVSGGGFEGNFASICSSISPMVNMFAVLESPYIYAEPESGEKTIMEFDLDYSAVQKATGQKSEAGLRYSFDKEEWADVCDEFEGYSADDLADGATCKPQHITIDVTKCFDEGRPVYFGWYYNAKKAQHIAIDNVKVYNTSATGITSIASAATATDAPVYSLSGQRMNGNRKSLSSGVYIQNGRKIVVK